MFHVETGGGNVTITFDDKPPENIRAALKAQGFRWEPHRKAWWRHGLIVADFLYWLDTQYTPEELHPCRRRLENGELCGKPPRVRSSGPYTMVFCGPCWEEYKTAQPSQYANT